METRLARLPPPPGSRREPPRAGAFMQQAPSPAQVRHLIDRAIRIALGDWRVTVIVLPNDLQEAPYRTRLANMEPCARV